MEGEKSVVKERAKGGEKGQEQGKEGLSETLINTGDAQTVHLTHGYTQDAYLPPAGRRASLSGYT